MSMEFAALLGMGIIALIAVGAVGLAFWSSHHDKTQHKNALPSH